MNKFSFLSFVSIISLFPFGINAQTSYTDSFNGTIDNWEQTPGYILSESGGIMTVHVNTSQAGTFFKLNLPDNINVSTSPFVNIKLRTDHPCILQISLITTTDSGFSQTVRIGTVSSSFIKYMFDFSSMTMTTISSVQFSVNPTTDGFSGNVYFDSLLVGTTAYKMANIPPINDIVCFQNGTGESILLSDVQHATSLSIVPLNEGAHENSFTTSAITNGYCTIMFNTTTPGGPDSVLFIATGAPGYANNSTVFHITVEGDNLPTIHQPSNTSIPVGKTTQIQLSGISDGQAAAQQTITVTAASMDTTVIPNPILINPSYFSGSPFVYLSLMAPTAGTASIYVTVKDNGTTNNTIVDSFKVSSFTNFNFPPTINKPSDTVIIIPGFINVPLTGISDGDSGTQTLTITAVGKHSSVINSSIPVTFTQGQSIAGLALTAVGTGYDTISVTITDNGGTGSNGPQATTVSFSVQVIQAAPQGYKVVFNTAPNGFSEDSAANLINIQNPVGATQVGAYVDTTIGGQTERCLRIDFNKTNVWTATQYFLPVEVNVSNYQYMSYLVYANNLKTSGIPVTTLMTNCYFYDNNSNCNAIGTTAELDTIYNDQNSTKFIKVFMDFRKPTYMLGANGIPINASGISSILFDYSNNYNYPWNELSGTLYIADIRLGDSCQNIPPYSLCTIAGVSTQTVFAQAGQTDTLTLTGISDGNGGTNVTIHSVSNKQSVISDPVISSVTPGGSATLTYTVKTSTPGFTTIYDTVFASGSVKTVMNFMIQTVSDNINNPDVVTVNVNSSVTGQTIVGFGAMAPDDDQLNMFVNDQGCTLMRFAVDGDFELTNDNNDPSVPDRSHFNESFLNIPFLQDASKPVCRILTVFF